MASPVVDMQALLQSVYKVKVSLEVALGYQSCQVMGWPGKHAQRLNWK